MSDATYTAWDDNLYEWPPPQGWYKAQDDKWWPEGYGPPDQVGNGLGPADHSQFSPPTASGESHGHSINVDTFGASTDPAFGVEMQRPQTDDNESGARAVSDYSDGDEADSLLEDLGIQIVDSPQEREQLAAKRAVYDDPPPIDDVFGGVDPFGDDDQDSADSHDGASPDREPQPLADADPTGGDVEHRGEPNVDNVHPQQEPSPVSTPAEEVEFQSVNPAGTMVLGPQQAADGVSFEPPSPSETVVLHHDTGGANSEDSVMADNAYLSHDTVEPQPFINPGTGADVTQDPNMGPDTDQIAEPGFYQEPDPEVASRDESLQQAASQQHQIPHLRADDAEDPSLGHQPADYGYHGAHVGPPGTTPDDHNVGVHGGADHGAYAPGHSFAQDEPIYDDHATVAQDRASWTGDDAQDTSRSLWPWALAAGAVVGLLVLAVWLWPLLSGGDGVAESGPVDSEDDSSVVDRGSSTKQGSFASPYEASTSVEIYYRKQQDGEEFRWVIEILQPATDISDEFGSQADQQLDEGQILAHARIRVRFTSGPEAGQFGELNFVAVDAQGDRYDPRVADCSGVGEPMVSEVVLQPNEAVEGDFCWRVPADRLEGLLLGIEADPVPGTEFVRIR